MSGQTVNRNRIEMMRAGNNLSWRRSRRLVELAGGTITQARTFLSRQPEHRRKSLDKSTESTTLHILSTEYSNWHSKWPERFGKRTMRKQNRNNGKIPHDPWNKARKLLEISDTDATLKEARHFLSHHKYNEVINSSTDKRNPAVRQMVQEFENYIKEPTSPVNRQSASTKSTPTQSNTPTQSSTKNEITIETLQELKAFCDSHGGIDNIAHAMDLLQRLHD